MEFAVLLTTIGRPCLRRMLNSLVGELTDADYLYIVIDGPTYYSSALSIINEFHGRWQCLVVVIQHPVNVSFWGHELRNTYQRHLQGDYILHADDDDEYLKGAFNILRQEVKEYGQLYIFQMTRPYLEPTTIPNYDQIAKGNIGSPCGVIANLSYLFGDWKNNYDGDYQFWQSTAEKVGIQNIIWTHQTIYRVLGADH